MHGIFSSNNEKHNNYDSRKNPKLTPSCNWLINNVIYKCTVSPTATTTKQRAYLRLAEGEWKQRYYNHTQSFGNAKHMNHTALFSYLWELKKKTSELPKLTWSVLKIVPGYSNISKRCLSCLHEKRYIATYNDQKELLTILTGKNWCFTNFSAKIHWNTRLAASDVYHMFTQSIKFF